MLAARGNDRRATAHSFDDNVAEPLAARAQYERLRFTTIGQDIRPEACKIDCFRYTQSVSEHAQRSF